jgi:signal transduction histidine kinase
LDRNRERLRVSVQGAGGGPLTIRRFLLGSFLGLVFVLVVGQALISGRGLREDLVSTQQRELRRELEMASTLVRGFEIQDPDGAARTLSRYLGYPVTFLTPEGQVVGASSDLPFQTRGQMVTPDSPELRGARAGDVGFAERRGSGEVEIRLFSAIGTTIGGQDLILQVAAPLDEVRRITRTQVLQTLGLGLPAILLVTIAAVVLGGILARPLHLITRRILGLSGGNFSRRVPTNVPTREIRELAGTLNRMTEELEARFRSLASERDEMQALIDCMGEAVLALTEDARVSRANQAAIDLLNFPKPVGFAPVGTLVRQPGLRKLLEGAVLQSFSAEEVNLGDRNLLVSARSAEGGGAVVTFVDVTEIRRLETVRRDFVANASHELKTPLTAMRGFAETLIDDDLPGELRGQWLNSIRTNTLRLQRLVDDLLDLSRLESGGWKAKTERVELEDLFQDVATHFEETAHRRGVALATRGAASVLGDAHGLEQVLRNLVENAFRYTLRGGEISVSVEVGEDDATVSVRDTGTGIPTSALHRIFERFFRVDPARSREEGGTGLGLAIVRHLVHSMGGEAWAESELGQGTTILFSIPLAKQGSGRGAEPEGSEGGE